MRRTRLLVPLVVWLALSCSLMAAAAAAQSGVREVRDVVPFGKAEGRFGRLTRLPKDVKTPPSTPLQVRLLANRVPALNQPTTMTLQVHASRAAPQTDIGLRLPTGAEVLRGSTQAVVDLRAGQTRELTVVVAFRRPGEQKVEAHALRTVTDTESWGDSDALFLTVKKRGSFVGYRSGDNPTLRAIPISAALTGKPQQVPPTYASGERDPRRPASAAPPCCIEPPERIAIDICWTFVDRDGSTTPLRDASVQFIDDDVGPDDVLASGFVHYQNGCAGTTVVPRDHDEGGTIDVFVRLRMEHTGRYRIQNSAGTVFSCVTSTHQNASADLDLGTQQCGTTTGNGRAAMIYNDVYRLRRFVEEHRAGAGSPPGQCTVQWQTSSTDGTDYRLTDTLVHLVDADAGSRDTVAHECSHRYMHVAYGGWTSVSDCPSPHFIQFASAPSCGWTEGWTYVNVAGADGDPSYTWPVGVSLDLEQPNCLTPGFGAGPTVEGRVGGVLIDLADPFTLSFGSVTGFTSEGFVVGCLGADSQDGLFSSIWALFTSQKDDVLVAQGTLTDSFSKAWRALSPGQFKVYTVGGNTYGCHRRGSCVGGLNAIPTFARD
jgi:hypothetical protein